MSYKDYLGGEDTLQINCLKWLKLQYPWLIWHHSPNEGRRTKFERYKFKMLGAKAGFPDLMIFNTTDNEYKGIAVEFKFGKNKLTNAQIQWLDDLHKWGFKVEVVYSFDDFKKLINAYYSKYGKTKK